MKLPLFRLLVAIFLLGSHSLKAQGQADTPSGVKKIATIEDQSSPVIPTPQETYKKDGRILIGQGREYRISVEALAEQKALLASEFRKRVEAKFQVADKSEKDAVRLIFTIDPAAEIPQGAELAAKLKTIGREGYILQTADTNGQASIVVAGNSTQALWHGLVTVVQLIEKQGVDLSIPALEIVDYPSLDERALLVDMGGQGFMVGPSRWNFDQWKKFVDWMVDQKLNVLWLEFIGSGRLMGNLNMDAGEWAGFPLELKSFPQLVNKDRPIKRWDEAQQKVVPDTYTAPNVQKEFVAELIDYAQARGVECYLLIGYDYFANQFPVVLNIPANDPAHPEANKAYDTILQEIVERYKNASGVALCTIESKNPPAGIIKHIIRRTNEAYQIIKSINPQMKVSLLADYLEWQPAQLEDLKLLRESVPPDVSLAYSPHGEPQQKSWKRVFGDVWRYKNYTQYAWDHIVHIFPQRIRDEALNAYADGYRKIVTQAWYFDVASLNFLTMAEYSWNLTSAPVNEFWDKALNRTFGPEASDLMKTAFAHTRFDIRFDIISRIILRDEILSPFSFWDMYVLTKIDRLTPKMLEELEIDAQESLQAAQKALPLVPENARELVEMTITSAERRLYLATSAQHLLKALEFKTAGDIPAAKREIDLAIEEGNKLQKAASRLGIEYPMAVHDDEVLQRYRKVKESL